MSPRTGQNTHWCLNTLSASLNPCSYFFGTGVPSNRSERNAASCFLNRRISACAFLIPTPGSDGR